MQRNVVVIPKTVNLERAKVNFGCNDFKLDEEDNGKILKMDNGLRSYDPLLWDDSEFIPLFQ